MRTIKIENDKALVELNDLELLAINNALNEVCYGMRIGDFSPRIGVQKEFVVDLLKQITQIVDEINPQHQ